MLRFFLWLLLPEAPRHYVERLLTMGLSRGFVGWFCVANGWGWAAVSVNVSSQSEAASIALALNADLLRERRANAACGGVAPEKEAARLVAAVKALKARRRSGKVRTVSYR